MKPVEYSEAVQYCKRNEWHIETTEVITHESIRARALYAFKRYGATYPSATREDFSQCAELAYYTILQSRAGVVSRTEFYRAFYGEISTYREGSRPSLKPVIFYDEEQRHQVRDEEHRHFHPARAVYVTDYEEKLLEHIEHVVNRGYYEEKIRCHLSAINSQKRNCEYLSRYQSLLSVEESSIYSYSIFENAPSE